MEDKRLPRSIKLKLEQPKIMCSGRSKVECFYRGKLIEEDAGNKVVEFKSHGVLQIVTFDENGKCVNNIYWQDLKIVKEQRAFGREDMH